MKVDIFTLCDSAQEYNGKLVIVGTFNYIQAEHFPIMYPEFALVARILFDESEKGKHHIEFSIKKDGKDVFIMPPGYLDADNTQAKGRDSVINVIVKGNNVPITEPGIYTVSLKVDDKEWPSDLNVMEKEKS